MTHRALPCIAALTLSAPALAQPCQWEQRPIPGPEARAGARLIFDIARSRAVLFGGTTGTLFTSFKPDNTWEWDGTTWTEAATVGPGGRIYQSMAYDPVRNVTLIFGGSTGTNQSDTWTYNGAAWSETNIAGLAPSPRNGAAMAFDTARGVAVLFGGFNSPDRLGDTWEWNGTTWTQRSPGGPSDPSPRHFAAMAFDAARNVTILYGGNTPSGYSGETWSYDGASGTWTQLSPSPAPLPRANAGFTYDASRQVILMFGGQVPGSTAGDLWEWNGSAWTEIQITGPSNRYNAPLIYDTARAHAVLFGGHIPSIPPSTNDETWILACGSTPTCYANCDASTTPPILNVADFTCFLQAFAAASPSANCDQSTTPPTLNVADFTCFLQLFAAGCP